MDDIQLLWSWYKYHAKQRLQSFNFFVIFVGALLVFLETQFSSPHPTLIRASSIAGAFLSLSFFCLDIRNARLVDLASDRLAKMQNTPTPLFIEVVKARDSGRQRWGWLMSHAFLLRFVMLGSLALFIFLAVTAKS